MGKDIHFPLRRQRTDVATSGPYTVYDNRPREERRETSQLQDRANPGDPHKPAIPDSVLSPTRFPGGYHAKSEALHYDTNVNEVSISSFDDEILVALLPTSSLLALKSSSFIHTTSTPSASLSSGPSPSPIRPSPRPRVSPGVAIAYFSPAVAGRRATTDGALIGRLFDNSASGFYREHPEQHELQKKPVPEFLLHYQPATARTRLADLMQNMTSPIGRIISEFTSTAGIPLTTLLFLLKESILCTGCKCMYSIQGYQQHRSYGRCTGNVNLPLISECLRSSQVPAPRFRTYPAAVEIPPICEFLNTPIGRVFVEWNGRIGIAQDVWCTIMTAYVYCQKCDLVRSFEAYRGHLDGSGECRDIGQA
ncbi:hypothetical protein B0H16DRAFT_1712821 [Mycena metata]|uniref:Uncharacterized protein n=1 Tax=Mycena metata TaxID=1033252 RepID=A0AAD7NUE0_9AGAR|nr:hypothetical protein B0H16DRAFT_1712821 [Mycena metata]